MCIRDSARANRTDKKEKSAQDSIPYQRMWPDGICRVTDTRYTKTIQYQDINYQLSQNEDKTAIFEAWCDFLNYFDSSVQFQLSFVTVSYTHLDVYKRQSIFCTGRWCRLSVPAFSLQIEGKERDKSCRKKLNRESYH